MDRPQDENPPLADLHRRLMAGERKAVAILADLLFEKLVDALRCPDHDMALDAVTDAWDDYVTRPTSYDPSRGVPLDRFLKLAAKGNLSNLKLAESRRRKREQHVAEANEKKLVDLATPARNLEEREQSEARQRELKRLMTSLPNEVDRKILELRLEGVHATAAFAKVLGIAHLPADEQRAQVKRAKDRIDKTLRRMKKA